VCSESSASESSLESSSGYGSQGAFAAEEHAHHQIQHADVESEIVTLRRTSEAEIAAARESFSVSLGSLEEAVRYGPAAGLPALWVNHRRRSGGLRPYRGLRGLMC
ncbi:unnamed protein product, partial [Leptidea sinapis]